MYVGRWRIIVRNTGLIVLVFERDVSAALLKSRFQAPTFHEGLYDLLRSLRLIGGKQRFWRSLALRIAGQNPADRQRLVSLAIPQGGPRADFQDAFSLPIPRKTELLPGGLRIDQDHIERGETLANHPRATNRVRVACGWHLIQSYILMKRGDEGHLLRLSV